MLCFEEDNHFIPDFSAVSSSRDKDESRFDRHVDEVIFGLRE